MGCYSISEFIFFKAFSFTGRVNLLSLVLEIFKYKTKITTKNYFKPPCIPILLGNKDLLLRMNYVLNFFHVFASSANLCSECFVTISAFDYRLRHHLIYFFSHGQHISFIEQHSETWKSNLCFSLRKGTFIW